MKSESHGLGGALPSGCDWRVITPDYTANDATLLQVTKWRQPHRVVSFYMGRPVLSQMPPAGKQKRFFSPDLLPFFFPFLGNGRRIEWQLRDGVGRSKRSQLTRGIMKDRHSEQGPNLQVFLVRFGAICPTHPSTWTLDEHAVFVIATGCQGKSRF